MVFYGYRIQVDRFSISPASWFLVRILKKKGECGCFFLNGECGCFFLNGECGCLQILLLKFTK